jgi:hypothetical protein
MQSPVTSYVSELPREIILNLTQIIRSETPKSIKDDKKQRKNTKQRTRPDHHQGCDQDELLDEMKM